MPSSVLFALFYHLFCFVFFFYPILVLIAAGVFPAVLRLTPAEVVEVV